MSTYLRVRNLHTRLSERHVERVMMGMLRNMNTDDYFIDDSEIDQARKGAKP